MGLMIELGKINDHAVFMGYRRLEDGSIGQAEMRSLFRKKKDVIIAVNGKFVIDYTYQDVVSHLNYSKRGKFAYIRLRPFDVQTIIDDDLASKKRKREELSLEGDISVTDEDLEVALDLLRMSPDNCSVTFDNTPGVDIDPTPVIARRTP